VWIIGLLESSGSTSHIPESVRIAFCSFLDIKNPGTYAAPDRSLLIQAGSKISGDPKFNLTEWWKVSKGEKLRKPFDIGEELVAGLWHAQEIVSALFYTDHLTNWGHRGWLARSFVPR